MTASTPSAPFLHAVRLRGEAGDYTDTLPALRDVERIELDPRVTFLVGENGSGKSTPVEALAVALKLNAEGGGRTQQFSFSTRASHSRLTGAWSWSGRRCRRATRSSSAPRASSTSFGYPGAAILELSENGVRRIEYDEAPQVALTRAFLDEPQRFLRHLL